MTTFSLTQLKEMEAAITRELEMRKRVYPRFVAQKRMTEENAAWELLMMTQVRNLIVEVINEKTGVQELFPK